MTTAGFGAGTDEGEDLSLRGEIATTPIPVLLQSLLASRETGIVSFRSGEITKSIYMQEGRVVYAASTDPDERLGESLLLRGRITARDYLEASKLIRPGRRLGAILVELKALEPEDLIPAVQEQIKDLLLELFTWTRGTYEVIFKEIDPASMVAVNVGTTENLILEGIRHIRAWSSVIRAIGSIEAVPVATGGAEGAYKLDLSEDEQQVLSHVNGRSTIEQICRVSYLSNFETCRILWALQVLGMIKWSLAEEVKSVDEGAKAQELELDLEAVVEKFNQMFNRAYVFLKGRRGDEVDEFMDSVMEEISRQYGVLFDGVDLKQYGRADFEQMLANVADQPAEQRKALMLSALNELVYVVQLEVKKRYGAEEEAVVSGIIKDGFRRLGQG
jgi:hypothetical protein